MSFCVCNFLALDASGSGKKTADKQTNVQGILPYSFSRFCGLIHSLLSSVSVLPCKIGQNMFLMNT